MEYTINRNSLDSSELVNPGPKQKRNAGACHSNRSVCFEAAERERAGCFPSGAAYINSVTLVRKSMSRQRRVVEQVVERVGWGAGPCCGSRFKIAAPNQAPLTKKNPC